MPQLMFSLFLWISGLPGKEYRKYCFRSRCDLHITALDADNLSGQIKAESYAFFFPVLNRTVKSLKYLRDLILGNASSVIDYINPVKELISTSPEKNCIPFTSVFYGIVHKIPQCFSRPFRIKPGQFPAFFYLPFKPYSLFLRLAGPFFCSADP